MIVLLVIADSLRADAPGFAGGKARTETLDHLAREGAVFDDDVVSGAWTVPSVTAMLTGAPPHRVGLARQTHPYPSEWPNLLTAFADAGFEVDCALPYPGRTMKCFEGVDMKVSSQDVDALVKALAGRRGQDRLVLVHHWWTHLPYIQRELDLNQWSLACEAQVSTLRREPREFAEELRRMYHRAVTHLSEEVLPRLLDVALTSGEDVLFALVGDHGETWGASLPTGRRVETLFDFHGR